MGAQVGFGSRLMFQEVASLFVLLLGGGETVPLVTQKYWENLKQTNNNNKRILFELPIRPHFSLLRLNSLPCLPSVNLQWHRVRGELAAGFRISRCSDFWCGEIHEDARMRLERPWIHFFVTGFLQTSRIGRVGTLVVASLLGFHLACAVWLLFPFVVK